MISDLRIFEVTLNFLLHSEERFIADNGYKVDPKVFTPFDSSDKNRNRVMKSVRMMYESIYPWIK